ncbi:MAG: class I adenylate-forming enzyme family protein [Pseudomonadota bacterium]
MRSVFDQGPPPPCPASFNMAAYVLAKADQFAEKPALITTDGETLTFAALKARAACVAGGLEALGLPRGARVLLRLGNSPQFPIAFLACIWAGLVPVPTSAQLTVSEVTQIAQQLNPALILSEQDAALPEHCDVPLLDALPAGPPIPPVMGPPDRLAYIIFTSGTSGAPRGVCHAHRAIWARRMMHEGWYGLRSEDRVMHAGAFNWTYTLGTGLMDPWSIGATAIIPAPDTASSDLMPLAAHHSVTLFAAVPGLFRKILMSDISVPTLRNGLSAGAHLSDNLRTLWRKKTGTDLHQAFGMSECSTFISSSPNQPATQGSSGRPQPGRKVAILTNGYPVPHGEPGMLAVATNDPGLMISYLGDTPPRGEWFETGDLARMAEDGSITYLGRADDMMNAGGFRVSPLEVEACFATCADVSDCAAVELRVKQDATVVALFHQGGADEHALRAHAEQHLARYKQPRLYIPLASLPYGLNGKLNRRALRERYEADHGGTHQA